MTVPPWAADYAHLLDDLVTNGCVLTTSFAGQRSGSFVTSIMPCNLRHVRLLIATWQGSFTHELIDKSGVVAVHVLGPEHYRYVDHFGRRSGRDFDKFAGLSWRDGVTGVPVLSDCRGYVECKVNWSVDCGDHTARLLEAVSAVWHAPRSEGSIRTDGLRQRGAERAFSHRLEELV